MVPATGLILETKLLVAREGAPAGSACACGRHKHLAEAAPPPPPGRWVPRGWPGGGSRMPAAGWGGAKPWAALAAAVGLTAACLGLVHRQQQEERANLRQGVIRDVLRLHAKEEAERAAGRRPAP